MKGLLVGIIFLLGISEIISNKEENYQDYDMYVFALQWGAGYCNGKTGDEKDKCIEMLQAVPKNEVGIHGLWPNLQSGRMLEDCNQGEQIEIIDDGSEIFTKMKTYWVTLEPKNTNKIFWEHEYNKHGYCYSEFIGDYDPKSYFSKAFEVFEKYNYNKLILDAFGEQPAGEYILDADTFYGKLDAVFGGKFYYPICKNSSGKGYVTEIRVNLDLNFEPFHNYFRSFRDDENASCKSGNKFVLIYQ